MSRNLERGMTFPDFTFPDETGAKHRLSTLQGDDVMVVHLSRGEHCPRERMHHRELLRFHEWCAVAFTQLVTVMPNELHDVYKMKIATGALDLPRRRGARGAQPLRDRRVHGHPPRLRRGAAHRDPLPRPGDREGLRGLLVLGPPLTEQLWADLGELHAAHQARLRPDAARGRGLSGSEPGDRLPLPAEPAGTAPAGDLRPPWRIAVYHGNDPLQELGGGDPPAHPGGGSSALIWDEAFGQLAGLVRSTSAYDRSRVYPQRALAQLPASAHDRGASRRLILPPVPRHAPTVAAESTPAAAWRRRCGRHGAGARIAAARWSCWRDTHSAASRRTSAGPEKQGAPERRGRPGWGTTQANRRALRNRSRRGRNPGSGQRGDPLHLASGHRETTLIVAIRIQLLAQRRDEIEVAARRVIPTPATSTAAHGRSPQSSPASPALIAQTEARSRAPPPGWDP